MLFFIQIFATLGFAVLSSTLVLYATKHLHFTNKDATTIMGVFGAFNYGLHLFGGYLGGRFLSNRALFVGGMALQVLGCGCIAVGSVAMLYVGLAVFLTGSGLNVTCINMMLTQRTAESVSDFSYSQSSALNTDANQEACGLLYGSSAWTPVPAGQQITGTCNSAASGGLTSPNSGFPLSAWYHGFRHVGGPLWLHLAAARRAPGRRFIRVGTNQC